jgi:hypothetical protein
MKKAIVCAIVFLALILCLAPIAASFLTVSYLNETKIGGFFSDLDLPITVKIDKLERSLFSANLRANVVSGTLILDLEQKYDFGWYLANDFPYIALVKTSDQLRINEKKLKIIKEDGIPPFADGLILSGESKILPYVGIYANYLVNEFNVKKSDGNVTIAPILCEASFNAINDVYAIALSLPSLYANVQSGDITIEYLSISGAGSYPPSLINDGESDIKIKRLEVIGKNGVFFETIDFSLNAIAASGETTIDHRLNASAKRLSGAFHSDINETIDDFKLLYELTNLDKEALIELIETKGKGFSANRALSWFDKGAKMKIEAGFNIADKPYALLGSFATDKNEFIPGLKPIVDINASFYSLENKLPQIVIEKLRKAISDGYIIERKDGSLFLHFHSERGATTINDVKL